VLLHWTEKGLLENVSPDGDFVDTPTGRIVNPGHALEAAWFLMVQSELADDPTLVEPAMRIIDKAMEYGLAPDGGIFTFRDCSDKPTAYLEWDMKKWWPQCEAIIANLKAYCATGDGKWFERFKLAADWAWAHLKDAEYPEWYGYLHRDGTVAQPAKGNLFKGPFHLPRMLIICGKLCNEIIAGARA
jgi:N-acylglucosamine 2-epimerase